MFGWFKKLATRGRVVAARAIAGRYDAAQTTEDNRRHWANADALSAAAANSPAVRRKLRDRSRYEVGNNCYADGIVTTLSNDVIGTGPRLQLLIDQPGDDIKRSANQVERQFLLWSKKTGLAAKLRTMRRAMATDGEAFAILIANPQLDHSIKLDLRLVEAEQVTTPGMLGLGADEADGIRFDRWGNPTEYHVLKNHPGGQSVMGPLEYDVIPAANVIHLFRADRPGQVRGVPEITPALPLFALIRGYTLSVVKAARTAAMMAGILYTDAAGGDADEVEQFLAIDMEDNALLTMPNQWKMQQMKAEQPVTGFGEFIKTCLMEIARCVCMPRSIAMGSSEGLNYSSGRLDHQTYFRAVGISQSEVEITACDRILSAWLNEAAMVGDVIPDGLGLFGDWDHLWFWDAPEHVDPEKEANAALSLLEGGLLTEAEYNARGGKDWEQVQSQRAKELGITVEEYQTIKRNKLLGPPARPTSQPDQQEADDAQAA